MRGADVPVVLFSWMALVETTLADLTSRTDAEDLGDLLRGALMNDGAHHKQWYLEQIAAKVGLNLDGVDYDPGIAP